jgi:hypothetical protein
MHSKLGYFSPVCFINYPNSSAFICLKMNWGQKKTSSGRWEEISMGCHMAQSRGKQIPRSCIIHKKYILPPLTPEDSQFQFSSYALVSNSCMNKLKWRATLLHGFVFCVPWDNLQAVGTGIWKEQHHQLLKLNGYNTHSIPKVNDWSLTLKSKSNDFPSHVRTFRNLRTGFYSFTSFHAWAFSRQQFIE